MNGLKVYLSKLFVFPHGSKAKSGDTARSEFANVDKNTLKEVVTVSITADMWKLEVNKTVRRAFVTKKKCGKKLKREA